jgi:hypothetical protein
MASSVSFVILLLNVRYIHIIIEENSYLENMQVALYFVSAMVSLIYFDKKVWNHGMIGSIILIILALRELDFQKSFDDISITRTKFYFSSDISLFSKAIAGLIVLSIVIIIVIFLRKNTDKLIIALKKKESFAQYTMSAVILLPAVMLIDASLRYIENIGIEPGEKISLIKGVFEEILELTIPVLFLIALLKYGKDFFNNKADI